jgi:hypothetical protein
MAGITGKIAGVGSDIVEYLRAVGEHYRITIRVTSGKRSPEQQAGAMFDNWIKLKRGGVYNNRTLSLNDRKSLNDSYKTAKEDDSASDESQEEAETNFKQLAAAKVGKKTKHASGRAVDVAQNGISDKVYAAITLYMDEVDEKRRDIYHFESVAKVPEVTEEIKARWPT